MTALPLSAISTTVARTHAGRGMLLFVLIGVAALIPRVGFLARPFESDSGLYIYMGKALVEGETLYRDFYETKTPGVALFTAVLYKGFGHHWAPYVFLQAGMTALAAGLLCRGVARHLGPGATRATFAFTLVFLNFSLVAYRGFQLETVQCFFACIAGACALRALGLQTRPTSWVGFGERRLAVQSSAGAGAVSVWFSFLTGVFAGVSAMLKPTAGAVAGAFILTLLLRRPLPIKCILAVILGLLIAPALVFLWTWRAGLLGEMAPLFREISLYGSGTPIVAADWIKPVVAMLVAAMPFIFVKICRSGATGVQCAAAPRQFLFFAASWVVLEFLGVLLQRRMYIYHFLPLAPPLALLFGQACQNRRPQIYAVALAPILLLSLFQTRGDFAMLLKSGIANLPESDYLLAHASPTDTVVGDPLERLLMETRLRCGARYAHLFYFVNHDQAPLEFGGRFIDDLDRNRPTWAVFRTDRRAHRQMQCIGQPMLSENPPRKANFLTAWEKIDDYLAAHYEPVAQVAEMTIFRRRD